MKICRLQFAVTTVVTGEVFLVKTINFSGDVTFLSVSDAKAVSPSKGDKILPDQLKCHEISNDTKF